MRCLARNLQQRPKAPRPRASPLLHPPHESPSTAVLIPQPQALVDKNLKQRQEFIDEIREQYAELREEFYAGLEDRK